MRSGEITSEQPSHVEPADFVTGGTPGGEIEVRISYGIIDRFSEGLYSSPNKAFQELVSNSYDAGARRVWVRVPESLEAGDADLAVIDDGVSMDLDGLRELWRVGVSPKRPHGGTEVVHAGRPTFHSLAERRAMEIARETGSRRLLLVPLHVLAEAVLCCQEERLTAQHLGDLLARERGILDVDALEDAVEVQGLE